MNRWITIVGLLFYVSFSGCEKDAAVVSTVEELPNDALYPIVIPPGFPKMEFPADNPPTVGRVALGRELFYEKAFSLDSSLACASCHLQEKSFTDGMAISPGVFGRLGERNSPQLANVAYKPLFFKDGGIPTLELQALAPFDAHFEFDLNIVEAVERLQNDPYYVQRFEEVFEDEPSVYGVTRALASFQRTFVSGNSRYDKHVFQEKNVLTDAELNGMALFNSEELKCAECHSGVFFTDYSYKNIGLETWYSDSGRARITVNPADAGKFEVPSLRNVAVTAPYMFDGRFQTLEEVIDHFASGGVDHRNKSELLTGFSISDAEKADLIAFLNTLTDESFLNNPNFQKPKNQR